LGLLLPERALGGRRIEAHTVGRRRIAKGIRDAGLPVDQRAVAVERDDVVGTAPGIGHAHSMPERRAACEPCRGERSDSAGHEPFEGHYDLRPHSGDTPQGSEAHLTASTPLESNSKRKTRLDDPPVAGATLPHEPDPNSAVSRAWPRR